MKNFLVLLLIVFGAQCSMAQKLAEFDEKLSITYSDELNIDQGFKYYDSEAIDGKFYFIFRNSENGSHKFYRTGTDLNMEELGEIAPDDASFRLTLATVGDRTYAAFFNTDREKKLNCLFLQEFSYSKVGFLDDPIQVDCLQGDDFYHNFANSFAAYQLSPDESKLLIYYKLPEIDRDTKNFRFCAYDSDLNELWRQDVIMKEGDKKLRIGFSEWHAAEGFGGNTSNPSAIKFDDEGNVYFWSTSEIKHRGEIPTTYITRVDENGAETKPINIPNANILLSVYNRNDFRLYPCANGVYFFGHVEGVGKEHDFPNRGLIVGTWIDGELKYKAHNYDYDLTMKAMPERTYNRNIKAKEKKKPVGWGPFPPQTGNSLVREDGSGMFMLEAGPIGYLVHYVNNSAEIEWSIPLATAEVPDLYEYDNQLIFINNESGSNLTRSWNPRKGIEHASSDNPVHSIGYIDLKDPTVVERRRMTKSEKGKMKRLPSTHEEVVNGNWLGFGVRIDETGFRYKYYFSLALTKFFEAE